MAFEYEIKQGDVLEQLRLLGDESVDCCITSPPYWGLRDYGVGGQIGLEKTPEEYVAKMVEVFGEVRRVLKKSGTLWLNLWDSYAGSGVHSAHHANQGISKASSRGADVPTPIPDGLKPKDLVGIPWRVAFALQAAGWYLRQDIIWCLSGGNWIYTKTQKGVNVMMIRDLSRLNPKTVKLWNGKKWTQLLGMSKSKRVGCEVEIVLRSGERISCTPTHRFPTSRGLLSVGELVVGDKLIRCQLPDNPLPRDCVMGEDAAWFAGLYIAEGSRSGGCVQISGHSKEEERWSRIQKIATEFGGSATRTVVGNQMNIRVYGKILNAIVSEFVTGKTAKDKGFSPSVWKYSNEFLRSMLDGYLSGDGCWDKKNARWRLGFTRNYNLERDLRVVCARLGYNLILNLSTVKYNGNLVPTFRGEIRFEKGGHFNNKDSEEVVEIRKSRCREVYDLGVEDEPNLFALASGILTHNSKPNPMPESVTDRCTKAHEYVFLMAKAAKYYFDHEAIKEIATRNWANTGGSILNDTDWNKGAHGKDRKRYKPASDTNKRNKRSVWTITTKPYKEAHFATFPPDLVEPMILAGCPIGGVVLDPFCGSGTVGLVCANTNRRFIGIELNPEYVEMAHRRIDPFWAMQNQNKGGLAK